MSEFRARIRRVRMKNGGADVHVLNRAVDNGTDDNWRGKIVEAARKIADLADDADPLVGYFIVGMYQQGTTSTAFRYDRKKAPIPQVMIPTWISEVARRDIVMAGEAEGVFNDMFQWQDG